MEAILNILPPFKNSAHVVAYSQNVGDIISGIMATHNQYRRDYDKIAKSFWRGNIVSTCKCIYDFLKANTFYKVEPDEKQTLRSPSAILYMGSDEKIGLDCKSYSLFIAGVLDALVRQGKKIKWTYRFASYKLLDKLPHHVFVVVNPGTSSELYIDPVLPTFNNKKQPQYKIDRKPMALIAMAGIGRTKRTKAERKARIKNAIRKRGKLLLKFNPATVSSRNSFLLLVKLNAFGLAHRLFQLYRSNPDKLKKFWSKIGGSWGSLEKNILQGIKKGKHKKTDTVSGIGVVPAIAAAVAAATPIVLKITQLLKQAGIKSDDLQSLGKKIVSKIISKKIDDQAEVESAADDTENTSDAEAETAGDESENTSDAGEGIEGVYPKMRRTVKPRFGGRSGKVKIGNFA